MLFAERSFDMDTTTETATSGLAPAVAAAPASATWDIDTAHANAGFRVRHMMVSHVRGHLGPVTGTVFIDEQDLGRSRVDVSIDARGIDSREPRRDEHLRSADFLDVANHPTVTFRSTRVEAPSGANGDLRITGDLTIRGITRPVTLTVDGLPPAIKDPWGNLRRGVSAHARISRKEWGLTWNVVIEAGGVGVADEVAIEIDAEIVARK
jgi:polyisoprenoid-binding protein YceI